MKINIDNTEVMTISREEKESNVFIANQQLKQVKNLTYLGSLISPDGRINTKLQQRCNKVNQIIS
uniref:Reverse transcriptase domain-containing protein n=1 Tax=Arion vulgaris TaxID=1028688 RepID=A0A0B7BHF1_9EUPU